MLFLGPRWRNPHLAPGMRLGRYRILRRLAVGGMAEIFLARAEGWLRGFEKLVVIKRLLPQHMGNRNLVRMFLDEARLMATFNHPNLAQVNDVGTARGGYFFAMEYVHGADLRSILRACVRRGEPVPLDQAIGIIAEAAAGLHHAHERRAHDGTPLSIVHRDVSPSNVLVSYDGAVKVADFGVAKWARQDSETRHGALKGKFAYMSPEQCRGEPLDRRSDVFALGILLYELTTGTRVYQGASDFAILQQIVDQDVAPPSGRRAGYPRELERIVLRALARDRQRRFESARDLQLALEALAHERHVSLLPVARARFMRELFEAEIAAWHAAEERGRSLAQHLASLPEEGVTADDEPGGTPRSGTAADGVGLTLPSLGENEGGGASDGEGKAGARRRRAIGWGVGAIAACGAIAVGLAARTPARPHAATSAPVTEVPGSTAEAPKPVTEAPGSTAEAAPPAAGKTPPVEAAPPTVGKTLPVVVPEAAAPPPVAGPAPAKDARPTLAAKPKKRTRAITEKRPSPPRRVHTTQASAEARPAPPPATPKPRSERVWDSDSVFLPK